MGRGAEGGFLGAEEGVGEVEGDCGRGGAGTDVDGGSFFFPSHSQYKQMEHIEKGWCSPPAKSNTPSSSPSTPPPQTMCARGQ